MARPYVLVTIDASDLTKVGYDIHRVANMTPQVVNSLMERMAHSEMMVIRDAIPEGKRPDDRYPAHLRDSLAVTHPAPGEWQIVTAMPDRMRYFREGTDAHPIDPRWKKALYWPGIQDDRPVAHVEHPGTRPNTAIEEAIARFESSQTVRGGGGVVKRGIGGGIHVTPADVVEGIVDHLQVGILARVGAVLRESSVLGSIRRFAGWLGGRR